MYDATWAPTFFNQKATTATGADISMAVASTPLHDFDLEYEFLRDGQHWGGALSALEFRTMMGFHLAMAGSQGRFLFHNPDDYQVFQNVIATGDGATTTFTLTRTFGANGFFGTEPVGQVDVQSGVNVYLGGSSSPLAHAAYTISTANPCANTITFATPPAAGQAIAVDMQYWYYCSLGAESNSFKKFMDRIWSLGKVTLHSCRAGA